MERLTDDQSVYGARIITLEGGTCGDYCEEQCFDHGNCKSCAINTAINRLAAYERTGLLPAQVQGKINRIKKIKRSFRERFGIQSRKVGEARQILDKIRAAAAMDELVELYSLIFEVSYDEAAAKLHKSTEEVSVCTDQQNQ